MKSPSAQQLPLLVDSRPSQTATPTPDRVDASISVDHGPPVDLVRSRKRRRTYKWSLRAGRVQLEVPAGLRPTDEARIVSEVIERARRRLARAGRGGDDDLFAQARDLARRYIPLALAGLRSVAWSDRQGRRWGSCSIGTGAIRISSRLRDFPPYVLEAVLVHELAHLLEPNHSARFQALAETYPRAERAHGFLEAVDRGHQDADEEW